MDRRRQSGFSLIEVIVAIMIMAIISLLSWRAIDSVSLTSRKLDARSDEITALQRVFDQFERDVALRASPMQAAGQDFGGVAIRLRAAQSDLRSVELMRSVAGPAVGWQRVLWERDGRKLLRAAGPSGERYPLAPPGPGETVLDEVQEFNVRAWVPGRGWGAFPTGDAPAATGLELIIARGPPGELQRYRRVYALH